MALFRLLLAPHRLRLRIHLCLTSVVLLAGEYTAVKNTAVLLAGLISVIPASGVRPSDRSRKPKAMADARGHFATVLSKLAEVVPMKTTASALKKVPILVQANGLTRPYSHAFLSGPVLTRAVENDGLVAVLGVVGQPTGAPCAPGGLMLGGSSPLQVGSQGVAPARGRAGRVGGPGSGDTAAPQGARSNHDRHGS